MKIFQMLEKSAAGFQHKRHEIAHCQTSTEDFEKILWL